LLRSLPVTSPIQPGPAPPDDDHAAFLAAVRAGFAAAIQPPDARLFTLPRALAIVLMVAGSGCWYLTPGDPSHPWSRCAGGGCSDADCALRSPDRPVWDNASRECVGAGPGIGARCGANDACITGTFCGWLEKVCVPRDCYDKYESCTVGKPWKPVRTCAEVCR
jgi:hypothetical protein